MLIRVFVACAHRSFVRSQRSFVLLIESFQKSITTPMLRPKPPHFQHYPKCLWTPDRARSLQTIPDIELASPALFCYKQPSIREYSLECVCMVDSWVIQTRLVPGETYVNSEYLCVNCLESNFTSCEHL